MTQRLIIHPENPQLRLARQVADCLKKGGVIAYPTDSAYALGCQLGDKKALESIRRLRKLDDKHNFTLVCRDLSEISTYARVNNPVYRLLKAYTPGPYTFILEASHEVPRRLLHPKRKTIGLRIPDNNIAQAILTELDEPIMSVTLMLPDSELPLSDPDEIYERLQNRIDMFVDGGGCGFDPTSIVDLTEVSPVVLRVGKGDVSEMG